MPGLSNSCFEPELKVRIVNVLGEDLVGVNYGHRCISPSTLVSMLDNNNILCVSEEEHLMIT